MSLRPLNHDPKYMSGDYAKMFQIESIPSNRAFVQNAYKPGTCQCNDNVCFSLTKGAMPCRPDKTKMLWIGADGTVQTIPVGHHGPQPTQVKSDKA